MSTQVFTSNITKTRIVTPIFYWNANTLSQSFNNGAIVTSWQNQGTGGSAYNLELSEPGSMPIFSAFNGVRPHVTFVGNNILKTISNVPPTLLGNHNRTWGFITRLSGDSNIAGYGQISSQNLFDMLFLSSEIYFSHWYGGQTGHGAYTTDTWFRLDCRMTTLGDTTTLEVFVDGESLLPVKVASNLYNTTISKFYVGGGVFTNQNTNNTRSIAAMYVADYSMNKQEMANIGALMQEIKAGPLSPPIDQ